MNSFTFSAILLTGILIWACNNKVMEPESSTTITILNPTPASLDKFGWSLATVGNNSIAIGAPGDGTAGVFMSGAVYLFNLFSGDLTNSFISPSTPSQGSKFGESIWIVGDNLLVGAPGDTVAGIEQAGSVYLIDLNTGEQLHKFTSPNPISSEFFGYSVVGLDNDFVFGTLNFDKAYLFNASSKEIIHIFTLLPDISGNQQFGYKVAAFDNSFMVSARRGTIYQFNRITHALEHTYTSPDNSQNADFGFALASEANNIVVGSPAADLAGKRTGAAFLFDTNTGTLIQTFLNPSPEQEDMFGIAVAILGNQIFVGASGDNTGASNSGSVYVFDKMTGALLETISNANPEADANFGYSISTSMNKVAIGAWGANTSGASQSGAIYVFNR